MEWTSEKEHKSCYYFSCTVIHGKMKLKAVGYWDLCNILTKEKRVSMSRAKPWPSRKHRRKQWQGEVILELNYADLISVSTVCVQQQKRLLLLAISTERLYPAVRDKGQQNLLASLGSQLPLTSEQPWCQSSMFWLIILAKSLWQLPVHKCLL